MAIAKKFGMNNHNKMEQFTALIIAFVIALLSIVAICYKQHLDGKKLVLTEQANYTTSCGFSLSGESGGVVNVYRNTDFTKAFILIKFAEGVRFDANASDLTMYMTNASGDKISGSPTGGIYAFGSTQHGEYMGLYFSNASGFKSQLYDITIRDTSEDPQSYSNYGVVYEGIIDSSDAYHNQMHVRVNFGGTAGIPVNFLESDSAPSVVDAYNETVLHDTYEETKTALNGYLLSMNVEINNIMKYSAKLDDYGIRVPALPYHIAGDYVTNDATKATDNPVFFAKNMLNDNGNIIVDNYNMLSPDLTDEDAVKDIIASDTLYFVTDFVYPGGIQLNYQDMYLASHSLHNIIGDISYNDFVSNMNDETKDNNVAVEFDALVEYDTWYYDNGTVFKNDTMDAASKTIQSTIDLYITSVNNLMTMKQDYQRVQILKLLELEASTESIANVTSINSNALVVYE